jgi:probable F420-dependent oxidoreductase
VKVDTKLTWANDGKQSLSGLVERGRDAEFEGYHGLWSAESAHDSFLPLIAAAQATFTLQLGTAVAVAFARNPMSLAYTAYDLQTLTGGRFLLGLGSQVRPHIERRFGMPWSRPAARMHEFIEAMRAIWAAWATGDKLDFRGDFYTHTLMTSFFAPPPSPFGPPAVYLAAVGDHMSEVAGAACDGLLPHPFTTARYLRERMLPAVERGLAGSGRSQEKFSIGLSGLVVSGRTEDEMTQAIAAVKEQIAFYGSTPSYHQVLKLHGWGDLGPALNALSRSDAPDRWKRMGELIDDEILEAFAIVAEPDRLGPAIAERYGGIIDRFNFYAPYQHDPDLWKPAIQYLS